VADQRIYIGANSGAPVHSFYLADATGSAPVNLVSLDLMPTWTERS